MRIINRNNVVQPEHLLPFTKSNHQLFELLSKIKQQDPYGYGLSVTRNELNLSRSNLSFSHKTRKAVIHSLVQLFDNKCAYCEQSFLSIDSNYTIDNYRPKSGITDSNSGKHYPYHYIWLSSSWSNLYLCCSSCNQAKRNYFPLAGQPCQILDEGKGLESEYPLILDPCNTNLRVDEHLEFNSDGFVRPRSELGEVTIKLLNLNRDALVSNRASYALKILKALQSNEPDEQIKACKAEHHNQFTELVNQLTSTPIKSNQRVADYVEKTSQATDKELRLYGPKITEITFSNIGPIGSKKQIIVNAENESSWVMILGDNGAGKSTLLKLITLLLLGEEQSKKVIKSNDIDLTSYLKSNSDKGYIHLKFDKGFPDKHLEITRDKIVFTPAEEKPSIIFNAYGSARLTPTAKHPAQKRGSPFFVDSLFDAFEPLSCAHKTLQKLSDEELLYAEESLANLFGLKSKFHLERVENSNDICFKFASRTAYYHQLSDGFKAIVTLFFDILSTARRFGFEHASDFNGIVLIDELGTHLHPKWRIIVVKELRTIFPKVQFICTTHEPLCLKGLKTGEVVVLKREGNNPVKLITELPPIEGLTSEQLLTSVHFGLNSTLDPEIESKFNRYYQLLSESEQSPVSKENSEELEQLGSELTSYGPLSGVLGGTRRDQLIYHAIDKMIAKNQDKDIAELINDETIINELSALWRIA